MRLKPRAPWIDAVGDYAMVERTSSLELTKRVAFNTQKRATLFTIDQEGRLHAKDDIAVVAHGATANAQVHFIHELALMDQQPLECGADESKRLRCSVGGVPKKLLVCMPEDGRYGIFAANPGYTSVDCQEGGYKLDVQW
jgi:hypothetical protein